MLFSLILPVYKVEAYIAQCVETCCRQEGIASDEYEIIIVNDESPDRSIDIAKKVLAKYPDINHKLVNRKNGGLSAARNSGLDVAEGEYVWFIDSDDWIEANSLAILKKILADNDYPQVVTFGHRNCYPNLTVDCPAPNLLAGKVTRGIDLIGSTAFYSAWDRVYSLGFIKENGMRFKEGILWEDGEFNLRLLPLCDRHYTSDKLLYNYRRRPDSISTSGKVLHTLKSNIIKFDSVDAWWQSHELSESDYQIICCRNNESIIFTLAGLPQLDKSQQPEILKEIKLRKSKIKRSFMTSDKTLHHLLWHVIFVTPNLLGKVFHRIMQRHLDADRRNFEQ